MTNLLPRFSPSARPLVIASLLMASLSAQFDPDAEPLLEVRGGGSTKTEVQVLIDGTLQGWFLLDSGADEHHLSKPAAKALGLTLEPAGKVGGVGSSVQAFAATASELRVGPLRLTAPKFIVPNTADRDERPGVLGSELFARSVVVYDTTAATVALYDPATWQAPPLEWLPCEIRDRRPFVHAKIEGKDVVLEVDTGGGGCVLLCAPAVTKLGLDDGRTMADHPIHGPFGSVPGRSTRIQEIQVGGLRIADVPVVCAVEAKGWLGAVTYDGLIGAGLMCHAVVVFDYGRKRLAFTDRRLFDAMAQRDRAIMPLRPAIHSYAPVQATGAPDAVGRASYGKAWFPSNGDGKHWLELSFAKPVRPHRLQIWGTLQQRGITRIQCTGEDGETFTTPWSGTIKQQLADGLGCTAGAVEVAQRVVKVRLELDCSLVSGTNVVDAVGLVDEQGVAHWAHQAKASSSREDIGRADAFAPIPALTAHAERLAKRGDASGAERVRELLAR